MTGAEDGVHGGYKQSESALRRAEQAALQNESLAAVGRIVASIAHEINNPLEAITSLVYLARTSETTLQAQEFLETADEELRRGSAITAQTLQFHRKSAESREVTCENLLRSAAAIYRSKLANRGITVSRRRHAQRRCAASMQRCGRC